ncbi:MAG: hypothetical protein ABEK59_06460 [Halobacteria archaeon]
MECPECGKNVSDEFEFCDCGEKLEQSKNGIIGSGSDNSTSTGADEDVYFRFAGFGLFAYISLLIGSLFMESLVLAVTALAFWIGSMTAMYLDLKNLDGKIRWSPWVWIVLAFLFYVVAMPYYLYKRNQITK